MKTLFTLLLLLCAVVTQAQTGKLMKRYYISGSLAVGKGDRSFTDTSAWLEVGADTTQRGIVFPRVLLDSIKTEKRAVFVYDLQDSVLYHFDGSERVRYMTYKDTTFLKNNFLLQGGNSLGHSVVVGSKDSQPIDVITNGNAALRVFANGNTSIGGDTTTDNYALNVDGSGDDAVLHLHRGGHSIFLKTTTNNDNAYTHILAIGNHRIKAKGYGISFSASDNEDEPVGQDIFRIKNVYNSSTFTPLKVLGANEEPYFTINGLGSLLLGTNDDQGYSMNINGDIHANDAISLDIDNEAYEYKPAINIKGSYHPITRLNFGLHNNGSYIETNSIDFKTGSGGEASLEIGGTPPSAGAISIDGLYQKVDFKGGILGDGWKVFMPEGVWSYQHTGFPFQPIEFTGNTTSQGIKLNAYSYPNALNLFGLTGNIGIGGVETDDGYKLDVNGSARISSDVTVEGGLIFKQGNKTISITENNESYQPVSINIGRTNVLNTNDNGRHITIGNNNTGNTTKIWQYMIGQGNNLSTAQTGSYALGDYNAIISGDTYQYIYGSNNVINFPSTSTSRGQFVIGSTNNVLHKYSSIMGNNQSTTGDNQLIFGDGNPNTHTGGYRDVYFGSGPVSNLNYGHGAPVTINSSGANGTDKNGGLLRLAAGKSTGAATGPDIIFATATSTATGTTLQSLTDRWYVKGETGRLSNNSLPTALLDLDGTTGYNQLRLRTSYTPIATSDTNGEEGDVSWDDDYVYIKTSTGWKRSALTTF